MWLFNNSEKRKLKKEHDHFFSVCSCGIVFYWFP
jgi:hypothetical protein